MGLFEGVQKLALGAIEPAFADLARTKAFGDWVDRLLAQSADDS
jgi:hypothetical protein